jgi:hypothetical protein
MCAQTLGAPLRPGDQTRSLRVVARTGRVAVRASTGIDEGEDGMGIGVSLVLIAIGAILKWGVADQVSGVAFGTIGVILMVVGAVGLVLSLVFWGPWPRRQVRREQVRDDHGRGYERVERISDSGV